MVRRLELEFAGLQANEGPRKHESLCPGSERKGCVGTAAVVGGESRRGAQHPRLSWHEEWRQDRARRLRLGISFDSKDGVNIMKGFMESGEFSRGKESIRAEGSLVMVGNFDVESQQRIGHLLSPLPPEMRADTAFQDRIHAFAPGWDFPKLNPGDYLTEHFGLVSDFLSECCSRLRQTSRIRSSRSAA